MEIEKQLKEWNEILVKNGDYGELEISEVYHCLHLANYIKDSFELRGNILLFKKGAPSEKNRLFPKQLNHLENNWWIAHYVFSDSKNIYCPILGEVSQIENYNQKVFGEEIKYSIFKGR